MKARMLCVVLASFLCTACSMKEGRMPAAELPLAPADYEVLGWTTQEACSTYVLVFRTPERSAAGATGYLSAGSVIGGGLTDADSRDALYQAMLAFPDATHLLAPRFEVRSEGLLIAGKPLLGRRCSKVRVRALAVKDGPLRESSGVAAPAASPPARAKERAPAKKKKREASDWE